MIAADYNKGAKMSNDKMLNKLELLTCDAMVLYHKLHNFHWNVKGLHFYEIHNKTEEFYNHFALLFDNLAERSLQLAVKPVVTLKQTLEKARIKEVEKNNFSTQEVIHALKDDFEFLLNEFNELSQYCEGDSATTALVDEEISFLEKELWMMRSMVG